MPAIIGTARGLMGRLCMVLRTNQILKKICTHVQKERANIDRRPRDRLQLIFVLLSFVCECKFPFRRPLIACTSAGFTIRSDQQATSVSVGRFLQLSAGVSALIACETRSRFLQQQSIGGVLIWVVLLVRFAISFAHQHPDCWRRQLCKPLTSCGRLSANTVFQFIEPLLLGDKPTWPFISTSLIRDG
ncbi:hypothetical protein PpBr36_01038 [Pyricularia pennisetigena]|uniref:hypothetical protein n=1 Tax=Pyricularia pennisetigena TaxID=1578925 RepID=UPI0011538F4C|nr:hypothetical protein PpBr36_01038 [Pyricularia pennisetigena]TLS27713.1 hypothetical protein PpBr36_01038 [Pyricularia pennisetigena]